MNIEMLQLMMDKNGRIGGNLDLRGTGVTALPEGLTVEGRALR